MIADLHCHYPMHLLASDNHPHGRAGGWLQKLKDEFDQEAVKIAADLLNDRRWCAGWRVDLDGLVKADARIVCSVLYWPAAEFRFPSTPAPGAFADLQGLLDDVEADLRSLDPKGRRHVVVRRASDLDDGSRVAFVHCVEGGFHLGPDETEIEANVRWLADRGVLYITLAHLFYRGVATNAPAIPPLTDTDYRLLFRQPSGVGLSDLGRAAVRSMYRHKVLVDISHMSEQAIRDTFALIEQLDRETRGDPRDFPVLATHVGMRGANADSQLYNLTPDTAGRILGRGGLIGLILAQHQLGSTDSTAASRAILSRQIKAIKEVDGKLETCALGTDLDGFIKPTLTGIERAEDLAMLAKWIREDFPADADRVLHGNARAVLRRVFASRAASAPSSPSAGGPPRAP